MADNISIVMTMKTDIDARMKSIASTTQGCSKAFEEFQRRTTELKGKLDALEKKYTSLNQKSASATTEAEKLKLEMSAMTKAARASGEELDSVSYEKLRREYQRLTDEAKDFKSAALDVRKEIKLTADEARKMAFTESDAEIGGGSSSDGFMSKLFSGDISGKLAQSGIYKMIGDTASNVIGTLAESALGQPLATWGSSIASGAASGASALAFLGSQAALAGGVGGALLGAVNGGMQSYAERDDSFKDYYRSLYEDTNAATAERLSSGSALASGRETTKLSFSTLLGDDKKAGAFLEQVQDTANTTPFLYDDLVGISKTMLSFGTAMDDIIPTLTKVGDAGAALGLSAGDIGTVSAYLGRMQSSDKATLEYLNPLNERGFSVFQWLADDQGVSVGDVYGQISKGELSGSYVSDVILTQFEKLYGGMMDIQSKSAEGLDSTLRGLKENVDAAGGGTYNEVRKGAKEADIAAYGGYLGDQLAELSAIGGEVQAYGENLRDQYQREALEAVLTRTIDRETTVFSEEETAKLIELSAQYRAAEEAYGHGSLEAGQRMLDLREEAEALATAAYESSGWAQKQVDMQIEQIDAIRDLTKTMAAATDAWRTDNAFSKGKAAGFFGGGWDLAMETAKRFETPGASPGPESLSDRALRSAGAFAYGLERVPYDGFPALLHQGERVLTAAGAREMDRGILAGAAALGADKAHPPEGRALGLSAAAAPLGADKQSFRNEGNGAGGVPDRTLARSAAPLEEAIWGPRRIEDLMGRGGRDGAGGGLAGDGAEREPAGRGGGDIRLSVHVDAIHVQGDADDGLVDEIAEALLQKIQTAVLRGGG